MKFERNADDFGRESLWGPEAMEKQRRNICGQMFAGEFAEKFASNFPKLRRPNLKSTQIRSEEPWDQEIDIRHFPLPREKQLQLALPRSGGSACFGGGAKQRGKKGKMLRRKGQKQNR